MTPDSFSDAGCWLDPDKAVAHAREMIDQGAHFIDVGGESTRPGAHPVPEAEELRRVVPVVEAVAELAPVSVDTRKEAVARAAVAAGAAIINDVSAGLWRVAAETGAGWVAVHMPADPSVMQQHARYGDVVAEVTGHLVERAESARQAGVDQVWIDPGIGFAKTAEHNLRLLRHLDVLVGTGWPVLVGTSRKTFLGRIAPLPDGTPGPPGDRLEATVATSAWAMVHGADIVRVHDVTPAVQAARLWGGGPAGPAGSHGGAAAVGTAKEPTR